jgi:FlaA1/EpsC-like NDP-sugar epimerase
LKKGSRGYRPEITAISGTVKKCAYIILYSISVRFVKILNKRALNNGVTDAFNWDEEVVVVTGGAGGIGGDMVKQLASKGTRIAVLDVMPLTYLKRASLRLT